MPRSVAGAKSGAGSDLRTDKSAAKAKAAKDDIQVGDAISAAHGGGAEWYSGRIAEVSADGTYAVRFDDGEPEAGVARGAIRPLHRPPLHVAADAGEHDQVEKLLATLRPPPTPAPDALAAFDEADAAAASPRASRAASSARGRPRRARPRARA